MSPEEIFFIGTYYRPTITHILIIEIIADLKKGGDGALSPERVVDFSNKILQLNPTYSVPYYHLLEMNLLGYPVEMLGRPQVGGGRKVLDKDGKFGVVFQQAVEEQILQRWRDEKFAEAEELLADSWRDSIAENEIDISSLERPDFLKGMKSLDDITSYIDKYSKRVEAQAEILSNILATFAIAPQTSSKVFYRFEQSKGQLISTFAPFALFCYRAFLTFHLSLRRGLTTPRRTDILDLQYLYYLPFTSIFSSNDKFHRMFTPPLLRKDQHFVLGTELKSDLKTIVDLRESFTGEEREAWIEKFKHEPPRDESSFTSKIWVNGARNSYKTVDKDMGSRNSGIGNQEIVDKVKNRATAQVIDDHSDIFDEEGIDFIIKESWIGPNDMCPCRSGKLFKDCHLDEVKKKNT